MNLRLKIPLYFFAFFALVASNPLWARYGLLQGKRSAVHDQQERAFMQEIYHTYSPFYTGPLLAPSGNVVPKGHVNVQPYLFWQKVYGAYTRDWHQAHIPISSVSLQPLAVIQYGMTEFMDFNLTVQAFWKQQGNQRDFNYGDTQFTLGFQLMQDFLHSAWPACVFEVGMRFPTGKYHKRDPFKNGTDITGSGSYATTFSLNFQKNFNRIFRRAINPLEYHPFLFRLSFGYEINSKVNVKGLNAYGGAPGTRGKVRPGDEFVVVFAWEYSLTERWVFATDWQYQYAPRTTFSGRDGGAPMGGPENQNFSVAPAIEYNINGKMGVLSGVWFSFAGRNSDQFVTGIISLTALF